MTAVTILAQSEETGRDLPVEPWVLGAGSFALLVVLLLVTMVFGRYR
jgi:hypothetical protein